MCCKSHQIGIVISDEGFGAIIHMITTKIFPAQLEQEPPV